MASARPKALIAVAYEEAAREYLRSLGLEHFMESTPQATQRKITLESLDLVAARRSDVHVFNELLIQYPVRGQRKPGQVVPDNMVVISDEPPEAETSYNLPLEHSLPFWVLEYVSKKSRRKDYEENFDKYENALKVPYYLVFYPDNEELTLYRHTGKKYVSVKPNKHGRYGIPDLDLEVGLVEGWVRYFHQGKLLPLPAELEHELAAARHEAQEARHEAQEARHEAQEARHEAQEATRGPKNCSGASAQPSASWPNCAAKRPRARPAEPTATNRPHRTACPHRRCG
jgi:Uma2 family endonuclease